MQHRDEHTKAGIVRTAAPTTMRRHLVPFVVYQMLTFGQFTSSIWILWLTARGLSLGEIGLAESCYHFGRLVLTVPTGAFADAFGRKWSLVIGAALTAVATGLLWWSPSFAVVCLALALDGGAGAFKLGADQAYLFDTLKRESRSNTFARVFAAVLAASYIAASLAGWLGAWLSDRSFAWPFALALTAAVLSTLLAAFLPEPPATHTGRTMRGLLRLIADGIRIGRARPNLLRLIVFFAAFWTASTLGNLYMQASLKALGFPNGNIGFALGVTGVLGAGAIWVGGRLPGVWRSWAAFAGLAAVLAIGTVAQGSVLVPLVLAGLVGRECVGGLMEPLLATRLNDETPSEVRATVLSFTEMGFSLLMLPLFPLVGWLADRGGWGLAYGAVAAIIIAVTLLVLPYHRR